MVIVETAPIVTDLGIAETANLFITTDLTCCFLQGILVGGRLKDALSLIVMGSRGFTFITTDVTCCVLRGILVGERLKDALSLIVMGSRAFSFITTDVTCCLLQGILVGGRLKDALPLILMGSIALVVGFFALWLPETKGTKLPETLGM